MNINKLIDYFIRSSVIILVLIAVTLVAARIATPLVLASIDNLDDYFVEQIPGVRIEFEHIDASWQGFSPTITLTDIHAVDDSSHNTLFRAKELNVKLSFFAILQYGKILPISLHITDAYMSVDQSLSSDSPETDPLAVAEQRLAALLAEINEGLWSLHEMSINHSTLKVVLQDGSDIVVKDFNAIFIDKRGMQKANLSGRLQGQYSTPFKMVIESFGTLSRLADQSGAVYFEMNNAPLQDLAFLQPVLALPLEGGTVSLNVWADFKKSRWQSGQLLLNTQRVQVAQLDEEQSKTLVPFLAEGNIAWLRWSDDDWMIVGDKARLQTGRSNVPRSQFRLRLTRAPTTHKIVLESTRLQIESLSALVMTHPLFENDMRNSVLKLQPRGILHDMVVQLELRDDQPSDYKIMSHFTDVSLQSWHGTPEVSGIDGVLNISRNDGKIDLYTRKGSFNFKESVFGALFAEQLSGHLSWHYNGEAWQIAVNKVNFRNNKGYVYGNIGVLIPTNASPVIELVAAVSDMDMLDALTYLPVDKIPPGLASWLEQAMQGGRISNGMVIVRGAVNEFPFVDSSLGRFEVRFDFDESMLKFSKAWPRLENMSGQATFIGHSFAIDLDSAELLNTHIQATHLSVPQWKRTGSHLLINGKMLADLADMQEMLQHTPVWQRLDKSLGRLVLQGESMAALNLALRINKDVDLEQLDGTLTLEDNDLTVIPAHLEFKHLQGQLGFTETKIFAQSLKGRFLDSDVVADIATLSDDKASKITTVSLQGDIPIEQLSAKFESVLWQFSQGTAHFNALWSYQEHEDDDQNKLIIKSNLLGVAINLPQPLAKDAKQLADFTLAMDFKKDGVIEYDGQFNEHVGLMAVKSVDKKMNFQRAAVHFGRPKKLELPQGNGLWLTGQLDSMILEPWADVIATIRHRQTTANPFFLAERDLIFADLNVKHLNAFEFLYDDADVLLKHKNEQWNISLVSDSANGRVRFPFDFPEKPLAVDFDNCYYAFTKANTLHRQLRIMPQHVPPLLLDCGQFYYNDKAIGKLSLTLASYPRGVAIEQLEVNADNYHIFSEGTWTYHNDKHRSFFKGRAQSDDIEHVFTLLGLQSGIVDSIGMVDFDMQWPDAPFNIKMNALSGKYFLNMQNGRIISVKLGLGRVLGMLSLQTIQRRLRFDFTDIFKEGLTFDYLKGNYVLEHNNVYTGDTEINGPSAYIQLSGRAGIAVEDLDFDVVVTPHVTGSLPIAATIATLNPAVGAIVWAVDKIIAPQVDKITRYTYQVLGTWDDPDIIATNAPASEQVQPQLKTIRSNRSKARHQL